MMPTILGPSLDDSVAFKEKAGWANGLSDDYDMLRPWQSPDAQTGFTNVFARQNVKRCSGYPAFPQVGGERLARLGEEARREVS